MSAVVIVAELDDEVADRRRVLEALIVNDVAPMREIRVADAWEPIDRDRLESALEPRDVDLVLRASPDDDAIEARLMIWPRHCSAMIYVPAERFTDDGPERARRALATLLDAMPARAIASITVPEIASPFEHVSAAFHRELELVTLLPPFQELAWLLAAPPRAYEPHYARDVLLGMPAEVTERDGRIWIQLWDSPLAYDTPGARDQIKRARDYLAEHADD